MFAMLLYYCKFIGCGPHSPNKLSRQCYGRREYILAIWDRNTIIIRSSIKKPGEFRLCSLLRCPGPNQNHRKRQISCQGWYHTLNGKCKGLGIPRLWMSCCRGTTCFRIQISGFFCVREMQISSVDVSVFFYSQLDRTYLLNSAYSKGKQSLIFVWLLILLTWGRIPEGTMNSREASELYHSKTGFIQRQIMSCVHWNIVSSLLVDFVFE